jgi:hypothetical protein
MMQAFIAARRTGVIVVASGTGTGVYVRVLPCRVVRYSGHGFTGHRLQRVFLTRRHATPLRPSCILMARRVRRQGVPTRVVADVDMRPRPDRGWALASVALMALVVALAYWACGLHLL